MTFNSWFESYAPTAPETLDDCAKDAFEAGAVSRDAEVAELKAWISELVKHQDNLAYKCDELREQVTLLRDEVTRCRDWFETQAKVTSKGGPSSFELMLLRDERDAADEALAATDPGSTHQDKAAIFKALGLVPWDNKPPACTDTVWIEPGKIDIKKSKDPAP